MVDLVLSQDCCEFITILHLGVIDSKYFVFFYFSHLNSSQFLCDCQLSWLKRWLNEAGFQSTVVAQCEYPELLKERNVLELVPTDFKCGMFFEAIVCLWLHRQLDGVRWNESVCRRMDMWKDGQMNELYIH